MLIFQNGSNKGKCEISHLAPQKICHDKTTEIAVWNNYSGTWVLVQPHQTFLPHCDTNKRGDWAWLGHRKKKQHKIYLKPLGKLKILWIKVYGCCMCCLHICCRRRGKVKGDRLIPEVASASASAIIAEQKDDSLSVLPFHFPYFLSNCEGRY